MKKLKPNETRNKIPLETAELTDTLEKIHGNETITSESLNKLWDNFMEKGKEKESKTQQKLN